MKIPFPNHHIPYIKVVLGTASVKAVATDENPTEEPNDPVLPVNSDIEWPYVSEITGSDPIPITSPLDNFDPGATEVLSPSITVLTDASIFTNSADLPAIPSPTTTEVFFLEGGSDGVTSTYQTLLDASLTIDIFSTDIAPDIPEASDAMDYTPIGFIASELAPVSATPDNTPTNVPSGSASGTTTSIQKTIATNTGSAKGTITAPVSTSQKTTAASTGKSTLSSESTAAMTQSSSQASFANRAVGSDSSLALMAFFLSILVVLT